MSDLKLCCVKCGDKKNYKEQKSNTPIDSSIQKCKIIKLNKPICEECDVFGKCPECLCSDVPYDFRDGMWVENTICDGCAGNHDNDDNNNDDNND
jgi:hypothetical protein